MIGGDQHGPAGGRDRLFEPAEAGVNGFGRLDCRVEDPGVPDHVPIGVVDHDEVEFAARDFRHQLVGHFGGRHLGLQIVGRHLGRGDQDAFLAVPNIFSFAAIEEERHVGVLLGFGNAKLGHALVGDDLAENVVERTLGEQGLKEFVQLG